jgi:hypothetical protein
MRVRSTKNVTAHRLGVCTRPTMYVSKFSFPASFGSLIFLQSFFLVYSWVQSSIFLRDLSSVQASGGYSYAFACEVAEALSVLPRSAQVRFLLSAAHTLQNPVCLHDYPGPHGAECMVVHAMMDYGSSICGPGSVCVRAWPID